MLTPVRIAVLVSGGGTNLQALIDAQNCGALNSGRIEAVISSKPEVYALTRAENAGIRTYTVSRKAFDAREAFEARLLEILEQEQIDLIVLAGFMCILSPSFTARYPERIINVHPSLIPAFCGEGFYGLRVHEAALAKGVKVTGATEHFVNEIPDGGRIIAQKAVDVEDGDTPESLQARILEEEHKALPEAVRLLTTDKLKKEGRKVTIIE